MGELSLANAEEFFERVTVKSLEHAVDVLKRWPAKERYRDFARLKDDARDLAGWIFSKPKEVEAKPEPEKTVGLVGLRFSYAGTESAENIRFYNRFIRGFLRWHRTQAVWIKGGTVKREAYLIFKSYLAESVMKMLDQELSHGGRFRFYRVNPLATIIKEAKDLGRHTKGYLSYGAIELGDYDEMFCPQEKYRRVSVREYCMGTEELQKPCPHWDRWRCIYPKKSAFAQAPKVETTWCPDRREEVPVTYCVECEKSDFAKWQACQEFKKEEATGAGL